MLSPDERNLRVTVVACEGMSSKENSLRMLENFRVALFELATESRGSFLDATLSGYKTFLALQDAKGLCNGVETAVSSTTVKYNWSNEASAIRNEIAVLTECMVSSIAAESSVFALGLDSIDIIKLSARLKRRGINLSVPVIMRSNSITQMTQSLDQKHKLVPESRAKPSLATYGQLLSDFLYEKGYAMNTIEEVLPPTPLQEAIFAKMSMTNFSRYLNQDIMILKPSTNIEKLWQAWRSVIDRSPILRTSFTAVDDPNIIFLYAQVIHRSGISPIRRIDISSNEQFDNIIESVLKQDKDTATKGVPFNITFIYGKDHNYLVLSLCHALYDGWSLTLIHNDVLDAYYDRLLPRPSYRNTLENIINSVDVDAANYWRDYTFGAKVCCFSTVSEKSQLQMQTHHRELKSAIPVDLIKSFTKEQRITVQALGQTCWALVLGYYLKTLEVTFGVVLSGRATENSNQVLFPTMNTVIVRSVIHGSVKEILQDMQNDCTNAFQYQHFPLRKVLVMAKKNDGELFDSLFIVQKRPTVSNVAQLYDSIGGESSSEVSNESSIMAFLLNSIVSCVCRDGA